MDDLRLVILWIGACALALLVCGAVGAFRLIRKWMAWRKIAMRQTEDDYPEPSQAAFLRRLARGDDTEAFAPYRQMYRWRRRFWVLVMVDVILLLVWLSKGGA